MSQNNPADDGSTGSGNQAAQTRAGGGGNGGSTPIRLANTWEVAVAAVFLIGLTVYLLYRITISWPACDSSVYAAPTPTPTPTANDQGNANAGANLNSNTNQNANANTNANTNVNSGGIVTTPPENQNQAGTPVLNSIEPASGSIKGGNSVTIKGSGLAGEDVIKFDEVPARREGVGGSESVTVKPPWHEEGRVDVTIYRGNTLRSRLPGSYTYICPAPAGSQLFLMIIMAGALGGCIHAMRSLYWYVGNRELKAPWLSMYFLLPFIGAATAMLFGLLIVAGIFDNTTGRSTSLFTIAIAGLVGMFSQQAALKLTDIANAFFTKPGPGKDSKPQESQSVGERGIGAGGTAPTITPTSGSTEGNTPVTIANIGLSDVMSVTFGGTPATEVKFDKATSVVNAITPAHAEGEVVVVVMNQAGVPVVLPLPYSYVRLASSSSQPAPAAEDTDSTPKPEKADGS